LLDDDGRRGTINVIKCQGRDDIGEEKDVFL
jgi:hypothetical protein